MHLGHHWSATGIPAEKPLKEGDVVNVDVTSSSTAGTGIRAGCSAWAPSRAAPSAWSRSPYEAMMPGHSVIRPGATTGDDPGRDPDLRRAQHMSVVRDFCGHGLGRLFHDEPNIVHVVGPARGIVLRPGMFFTVEPMIKSRPPHVKVLSDGWTAVTRDRSLSAQFEHSVAVTEAGVEIFTLSPKGIDGRS